MKYKKQSYNRLLINEIYGYDKIYEPEELEDDLDIK